MRQGKARVLLKRDWERFQGRQGTLSRSLRILTGMGPQSGPGIRDAKRGAETGNRDAGTGTRDSGLGIRDWRLLREILDAESRWRRRTRECCCRRDPPG